MNISGCLELISNLVDLNSLDYEDRTREKKGKNELYSFLHLSMRHLFGIKQTVI